MERTAIHDCKTGRVEVRERTVDEQDAIDTQRIQDAARMPQKSELELLKERVAALEAKTGA